MYLVIQWLTKLKKYKLTKIEFKNSLTRSLVNFGEAITFGETK